MWDEIVRRDRLGGHRSLRRTSRANNVNYGYLLAFGLVAAVIGFAYAVFFLSRTGATPGKSAMGISVRLRERPGVAVASATRASGRRCRPALSLLSNIPLLGNLFSLAALLDLLWPAWDEQEAGAARQVRRDQRGRRQAARAA